MTRYGEFVHIPEKQEPIAWYGGWVRGEYVTIKRYRSYSPQDSNTIPAYPTAARDKSARTNAKGAG